MLNIYFKTIDDTTLPILKELREKRYRSVKYWFNGNSLNLNQIKHLLRDATSVNHPETDNNLTCYNWDIEQCCVYPEHDGLEHLAWRCINDKTQFVCIDNCHHYNNQLVLFQDAIQEANYPQTFIKIPCFHTIRELMTYAQEQGFFNFSLKDCNRFEKCSGIGPIQGATVYKEKASGRYWYIDMLHKTHYEVFDCRGRHWGEADMNGELNQNKKDENKTIDLG